jgi:hypothetical protein
VTCGVTLINDPVCCELHEYDVAPEAESDAVDPWQTVACDEATVNTGRGVTSTTTVPDPVQPLIDVPFTE